MRVALEAEEGKWVCIKKGEFADSPEERIDCARLLASIVESARRKLRQEKGIDPETIARICGAKYNRRQKKYVLKGRKKPEQVKEWLERVKGLDEPDESAVLLLEMLGYDTVPSQKTFEEYLKKMSLGTEGYCPREN